MNKIISEPKELYGFLATHGIEVVNLVFANEDVVWLSWKRGAEEDVPNLRHSNEVIGAYVTGGRGFICNAILTWCERMPSIAIQTR